MNVNTLALVLTLTLAHGIILLGLPRKGEKAAHHALKHQWSRISSVKRKGDSPATAKVQQSKGAFRKKAKVATLKCPGHEKQTAQTEILVKELALSSEIIGDKRSAVKKGNAGPKRKIHKGNTVTRNIGLGYPVSRVMDQKRTLISLPPLTNGKPVPGNGNAESQTLLTAIGLLFNKKNHFEKDSNALTLAKVLLDRDQSFDSNLLTRDHYSHSIDSQLGSLFDILRFLNASLSQKSMVGERKSTIHTELVNPTELGVAILRLLFGHNANLVMEPSNEKVLLNGQNAARMLSDVFPTISSSKIRLPSYVKTFDPNKSIARRKHHKKSFSFAIAKAISELIKSMAKEDLNNYMQKMHTRNKFVRQEQLAQIPENYWPSKKRVDVQGNRKSWVLLKIPKSGEDIIHHQPMADEALKEHDEETESDKASAGIVDTLGKMSLDSNDGNTETHLKNGMNKDTRKDPMPEIRGSPTARVGYSVRILPSLQGSSGKQAEVNQQTNTAKPLSNSQSTKAFADAVQKLLRAVQFSIESLQGKQVIGHVPNISPVTNDNAQNAMNNHISSIVSDQLRTPEKTNTGTVRGISNNPTAINTVQLIEKQPVLSSTPTVPDGMSAFARARGQTEALTHENTILDPWKDLEPITKSISPTKKLGPPGNVVFESATELGVPRGTHDINTVSRIQEDLEMFAEKALQAHNHYREEHHASRLRWSDELAAQAEKLAYDMAMKGMVERSEVASAMGYGENVAKITGVPFNDAGSVATDVWYSESSNYSYSYPRVTPQTDAFTQLVWRETTEIGMGCAKDIATNDLYVVALYRPPGNNRRRLRENVMNKGAMTEDVYATIFKRTQ